MYTNFLFLLNLLTKTKTDDKKSLLEQIECPHCKTKQFTEMVLEENTPTNTADDLIPIESNLYCECISCKKPFIITAKAKIKLKTKKIDIKD